MDDILILLETLSAEQYQNFFVGNPIYTPTIKNKKTEYLEMLSAGNQVLKSLLNKMLDSNIAIVNSTSYEDKYNIQFIVSKNDLKFVKYIKEHSDTNIKVNLNNIDSYVVNIETSNVNSLIMLKQVVENYIVVNRLNRVSDEDISNYILKEYQFVDEEYIQYLKEINKNQIMYIREKHRQNNFQFGNDYNIYIENLLENRIPILEIYKNDNEFNNIPYNELTDDMKYIMCNRYFQKVFEKRVKLLCESLVEQYNIDFDVNFNKQMQIDLENYGITGNLPLFDDQIPQIELFLYGNLNFCKLDNEFVIFNEDLLGQVLITILHEHEHILQRMGLIDEKLKNAISTFEENVEADSNFYIENYNNDPSELDANLSSFIRFNNIARKFGILKADDIIMKKANDNLLNAESTFNFYTGYDIHDINDVYNALSDKLDDSIIKYSVQQR